MTALGIPLIVSRGSTWHHVTPSASGIAPGLTSLLDPTRPDTERGLWHADQSRNFLHTDLCLMQVSAEDGAALAMQYEKAQRFCEIKLLPPPVGAVVQAVGYPRHSVRTDGTHLYLDVPATVSQGTVKAIHTPYRDRGMLNFPCFEVEMWADHGFSGGPVFYEGKLCGLVSAGSSFDSSVYVAALWPLLRANVDFGLGKSLLIRELFERGVLTSSEWPELRERVVTVVSDERGEFIDLQ